MMAPVDTQTIGDGAPTVSADLDLAPSRSWSGPGGLRRGTTDGWFAAGVAVLAVSWSFALAAIAILLWNGAAPGFVAYWIMDVLVGIVYGGACLLMLPRSRHPVVWILVLSAIGCGISGFLTQYLGLTADHPHLWAPASLWVLSTWVWIPGTYAAMAVMPWLVSPRRQPWWVHLAIGAGILLIAWRVLALVTARFVGIDNPAAVMPDPYYDLVHRLGLWPDRVIVLLSLAGVLRLWWLRRTTPTDDARGYGWLVIGQLFLAIAFVPVVFAAPDALADVAQDFAGASLIAAQPFLPGALLVVVLGHRLWGIDVAVDRAIVWLLRSTLLVTCDHAIGWLLQEHLTFSQGLAGMVSLAVLLVASQPLRTIVQRKVDHLVYGAAGDPGVLLRSLGSVAASPDDAERNLGALVAALANDLRLTGVEVRSAEQRVLASHGEMCGPAHRVALTDDPVPATLVVVAGPGRTLDPRSRALVGQMAGIIAVFLELAEVNEQLNSVNARVLEVRHEERRMIRRDLHDGLGPALAGVGLGIAAVQRKLEHDPEGAAELLEELKTEVARRSEDVRLLSRSLLPAALDDGDLVAALTTLAARFEPAGIHVRMDTADLVPLDTRYQIAVYHVAAEAIVNAYRHGQASEVELVVAGGGGMPVRLEVTDDGIGIAPDAMHGVGMRSMRERAADLAGTVDVLPGPGGTGTRVTMELP